MDATIDAFTPVMPALAGIHDFLDAPPRSTAKSGIPGFAGHDGPIGMGG